MRASIAATQRGLDVPAAGDGFHEKCFFALMPDRAAAARIDNAAHEHRRHFGLKGDVFAPERYHITLHEGVLPGAPLGELVARMCAAADTISAGGFAVGFDYAISFPRKADTHPFVLLWSDHLLGLERLSDALGRAMIAKGLRVDRSFTPHLTMLYDAGLVPPTGVELVRWTAHDFVLIRSLQNWSHYQFLGRWPLRPIPTR